MSNQVHSRATRRQFLQAGAVGGAAIAMLGATSATASPQPPERQIRIGVIGVGPRGRWHVVNMLNNCPDVTITAVCDLQEDRVKMAADMVKQTRGTEPASYCSGEFDYRNLCERDDVDGVLIATPVYWLGRMTVDALKAGKHASHEVAGAQTEEECWEMIEQKEKSGKRVMLLENCCYGDEVMMIYRMVRQGVFGEPYYAEGSYVHNCRTLLFDPQGKITWRGELWRDSYGSAYPQHGMGANCKWLEINDGDRMVSCQTMMTSPREAHRRAVAQFGPDSEAAQVDFKTGDFVTSLISTAKGRMIRIDYSLTCTRPYSRYYLLQGTQGCWDSRSGIFLDDHAGLNATDTSWEPLEKYQQQYQHPYWRNDGAEAVRAGGHGGIDYHCIQDFVKMIREDREPWIDVFDAAAWSSIIFCSKLSLDRQGARVEMPDFTRGKWQDPDWRKDRMVV